MLFGLVRRLSSRRQELRVVAPQGRPVARVLEIVEFDRAAPISRDLGGSGRDLLSGERHLGWDGVHNARDLGGLSIAGGGETRWGAVIRADSLGKLTPAGWAALRLTASARSSICATTTRSSVGARRDPGHADDPPSARRDRPLGRLRGVAGRHPLYYAGHLECFPERSARVIAAVAEAPPGGVAVHCVDGRDRTGLIAVLLLALVGVERQEILTDYATTSIVQGGLGPSRIPRLRRGDGGLPRRTRHVSRRAPQRAARRRRPRARLHAGGLADAHLAALRERLIRP